MSTTPKTTSAHIAGKFIEQALKNTHQYLFECHAIQGTPEWHQRIYDTVVMGGIHLTLTPAQAKWIKRVLLAERKVEKDQWTGQVLVPTEQPDTVELAGEWRLVECGKNAMKYRIIYTLYTDFMIHAMKISAQDVERATFLGEQQGVADAMRSAICRVVPGDLIPGVIWGRNIDGAILLVGRNKLADGGQRYVRYEGPFGQWEARLFDNKMLAEQPRKVAL